MQKVKTYRIVYTTSDGGLYYLGALADQFEASDKKAADAIAATRNGMADPRGRAIVGAKAEFAGYAK